MVGINFDNKHSFKDFGLTIKSKEIGYPTPNLIKDTVPFLQGSYDFSNIFGEITYSERTLKYVFNVIKLDKIHMNELKIKVSNWLKSSEKKMLIDDDIFGYYFLAQTSDFSFSENNFIGELTVEFEAQPFKIKLENEGELFWDTFNFNEDVLQQTEFNIKNILEVTLYNLGSIKLYPKIIVDSNFEITKGNTTYSINPTSTNDLLSLDVGVNKLQVKGNGTIKFEFKKEVL